MTVSMMAAMVRAAPIVAGHLGVGMVVSIIRRKAAMTAIRHRATVATKIAKSSLVILVQFRDNLVS